jgi:LmbE family N-acetylglucosaminyl deacetylase
VAHPDDCVIFAGAFLHAYHDLDWTLAYLTHHVDSPRGREIQQFWHRRNRPCLFLGYQDHWHDNQQRQFTRWDPDLAGQACWALCQQYDMILTHDHNGDYGHLHHELVHRSVRSHPAPVFFAAPGQGNLALEWPAHIYNLDELELHRDVIQGFFEHSMISHYCVSTAAQHILDQK